VRHTTIIGIALSLILAALAPTQASDLHAKSHRTHFAKAKQKPVDAPMQQVCDWIGPGGRAIYRCHSI